MDTGFETTVPRIRESVTKLGFRLTDIKIIIEPTDFKRFIERAERSFVAQLKRERKEAFGNKPPGPNW